MKSMGKDKKDLAPLLKHWSYVFLALTHQNIMYVCKLMTSYLFAFQMINGSVCMKANPIYALYAPNISPPNIPGLPIGPECIIQWVI